jgi:hypothetical protein
MVKRFLPAHLKAPLSRDMLNVISVGKIRIPLLGALVGSGGDDENMEKGQQRGFSSSPSSGR